MSCSFPVGPFEDDRGAWDRVLTEQVLGGFLRTFSGHVVLPGRVKAFVGVSEQPDASVSRWWGKVELNPSRVVDPGGVGLAAVEELPEVMALVEAHVGRLVGPLEPVRDWRVKRLDVARDFAGVEDASHFVRALAPIPRAWARRNLVHADPKRHGAQTLMVGSGAGVVRLYDKHAESEGRVGPGTLRWEAECRTSWLKQYGDVSRLGDVVRGRVAALCRDRWEWSAMGVEVSGGWSNVVARVRASSVTPARQRAFLGYLVEQASGMGVPMSNDAAAYYRRLQRELGVAAPTDEGGVQVLRRLDFDEGREVVRVA